MSATWSDLMDGELTSGWLEGLSSEQIALLLGVSSAAVRYRRRRLGLRPRGEVEAAFIGTHKADKSRNLPRAKARPEKLGPDSEPMLFDARTWANCAFPVGFDDDGSLVICGAGVSAGQRRPYCPFHMSVTKARDANAHDRAA